MSLENSQAAMDGGRPDAPPRFEVAAITIEPEIQFPNAANEAFLAHVGSCMDEYGCVVLRRAIDPERLAFFRDLYFTIKERLISDLEAAGIDYTKAIPGTPPGERDKGLWSEAVNLCTAQIYPKTYTRYSGGFTFYDLIADLTWYETLRHIFQGDYSYAFNGHTREILPDEDAETVQNLPISFDGGTPRQLPIHFHVDAYYGRAPHHYGVNCWVPMQQVGLTSPGLQSIPAPQKRVEEFLGYDPETRKFDDERIGSVKDEPAAHFDLEHTIRPVLEPGDVFLFSNWCLHASYAKPEMDSWRLSHELRFVCPRPSRHTI